MRIAVAIALSILATPAPAANVRTADGARVSAPLPEPCGAVRAYVSQHGPRQAVREALRRGWTWGQIKRAKAECG